jgi:hypothetical protein
MVRLLNFCFNFFTGKLIFVESPIKWSSASIFGEHVRSLVIDFGETDLLQWIINYIIKASASFER